ncbi:uncharacterized protein LOC143298898 [Babylonia areolata]|uniref:uncharacterized protein LOC143298898 n=1 Tax=Babylonia areolata TaxID=304850 RepID=UPI003FCFAF41
MPCKEIRWISKPLTVTKGITVTCCVFAVFFFIYIEYYVSEFRQHPEDPKQVGPSKNVTEQEVLKWIRSYTNKLPNTTEVSVITAYFDLGDLNKGGLVREAGKYRKWMASFRWLNNPLVVFTDSKETAAYFQQLRAHYPPSRTNITLIQRETLWAFQLASEIREIFSQNGYPRHSPNTIQPLYSCAMHAKYELVQRVLREGLYQTRFVAWLDIGYFRQEITKNETIHLTVPTDFNRTHVGCSLVNTFQSMTVDNVIRWNKVWVGGGAFLATPEVAYVFCNDYRRAVRGLLDMKWMSTDQQVIYSMFQPSFNFTRRFELQAYAPQGDLWFTLGYRMKAAP